MAFALIKPKQVNERALVKQVHEEAKICRDLSLMDLFRIILRFLFVGEVEGEQDKCIYVQLQIHEYEINKNIFFHF